MMIGHLTIAGAAEFALSAGMVGYLRLADPSLLRMSAPVISASAKGRRALWAALAALLVLTPLGVRVAGSAWAEWAPADFTRPEMRSQITSASLHEPPPSAAPAGLRKLAGVWAAPVQGYAPAFLKGAAGYGWSAAVGTMFIFLTSGVLVWVVRRRPVVVLPQSPSRGPDFIGKTLGRLAGAMARASFAESLADHRGPLQRLDPRGKLVGFAFMLIAVVASHRVEPIVGIFLVAVALALGSGIRMGELARRVWIPVILFTGAIAVPAMFVAAYGGPRGAVFLLLRAGGAATLSTVLLMTTRWPDVLKAMRALRVPALIVAVLGMTCRYILSILRIALEMFESLKSRTVGPLTTPQRRKIVVATAGVLLEKSLQTSGEVHQAMLSRGFRGEVRIAREFTFVRADWCWLGAFAVLSGAALWAGR
jgi:energy-coupling factor transporter transmembrane protein EcfT